MDPPQTVDQLLAAAPAAIAALVGGTSYVRGPIDGTGADLALCPHVQARYSGRTGVVTIHPAMTKRLATFLHRTSAPRRNLSADQGAELWQLRLDKTDWVRITAAVLRGTGPADPALMRVEFATIWQYPHGHAIANGVPEALAPQIVNQVAAALGIVARDERFAEVEPLPSGYVAQAGIVNSVVADLATGRGTHPIAEMMALAGAGSGHLAQWTLARRFTAVGELGEAAVLDRPGGWVELRSAVDGALDGVTREWAQGRDGLAGFEQDEATADHWSGVAARDIRSAARRVRAGPGEVIDVGRFGVAITAAAEAAHAEVDTSMDFLAAAWADAEVDGL